MAEQKPLLPRSSVMQRNASFVRPINLYGNPEDEPPQTAMAFNASSAKPGPYVSTLPPAQETQFQSWVRQNKIPWQDTPTADYDMRGYWKSLQAGGASGRALSAFDGTMHFPDTYKTPYSGVFSRQSLYALPTAPDWRGDVLKTADGRVVADETAFPQISLPSPSLKKAWPPR